MTKTFDTITITIQSFTFRFILVSRFILFHHNLQANLYYYCYNSKLDILHHIVSGPSFNTFFSGIRFSTIITITTAFF